MMTQSVRRNFGGILMAGCLVFVAPGVMLAQASAAPASFEVATIKPSDPNEIGGMLGFNRDKFMTKGQTVKALIKFAYNLNFGTDQQISGGPSWIGLTKFDIQAKEDAETVEALQKLPPEQQRERLQSMVRELLTDRFKLKVHHETKELPVYAMTVAKSGLKMKPSVDAPANADGTKPQVWHGLQRQGRGQMEGRGASADMLGNVLGMQPEIGGRMVLDRTGLKGGYDFILKWTPDESLGAQSPRGDAAAPADPSGPTLFTALQEELGLRLDATKGPVDTIVIDSVEMPSEN